MRKLKNLMHGILLLLVVYFLDRNMEEKMPDYNKDFRKAGEIVCVAALALLFLWLFAWTAGAQEVIVFPKAKNSLQFLYFTIAERAGLEGAFCLTGFIDPKNQNVLIKDVSMTWIDSASTMNVAVKFDCPAESVGQLHFHPPGTVCNLSDADIVWAHLNRPKTEAIYCKVGSDSLPSVLLLRIAQVDSIYNTLTFSGGGGGDGTLTRIYTAIYRYRRPP